MLRAYFALQHFQNATMAANVLMHEGEFVKYVEHRQ